MSKDKEVQPIVQPMIDEMVKRGQVKDDIIPEPKPAELDQDPGGGYNTNHTYPQT